MELIRFSTFSGTRIDHRGAFFKKKLRMNNNFTHIGIVMSPIETKEMQTDPEIIFWPTSCYSCHVWIHVDQVNMFIHKHRIVLMRGSVSCLVGNSLIPFKVDGKRWGLWFQPSTDWMEMVNWGTWLVNACNRYFIIGQLVRLLSHLITHLTLLYVLCSFLVGGISHTDVRDILSYWKLTLGDGW